MAKKREANYDLLRIICTIAVTAIHVSGSWITGLSVNDADYLEVQGTTNIVKLYIYIYDVLSSYAVPCFIMLSGAFILADERNKNYGNFYRKTFAKIGVPTLVFSVLYILFSFFLAFGKIIFRNESLFILSEPILNAAKGTPFYHMWYLYMMMGLYLLVPIIIMFKESVSKKIFERTAAVLLVLGCIGFVTSSNLLKWDIGFQIRFIGYFMAGYAIRQRASRAEMKKSNLKGCLFTIIGILFQTILVPFAIKFSNKSYETATEEWIAKIFDFEPLCPIVILTSICIFIGFSFIEIKQDFSKLSEITFLIYILHAGVWRVLKNIEESTGFMHFPIIMIPLNVVIVFIASLLLSKLYIIIWKKIDDKFKITYKILNPQRLQKKKTINEY